MGTSVENLCTIWGAWNICPASTIFDFNGKTATLEAELQCPLHSVVKSNFIEASQKGNCQCDARLVEKDREMDCNCFACPEGSRIGFAYDCLQRIAGPCTSFNCAGECNGRFKFGLDLATEAPTATPDAAMMNSPIQGTLMVIVLTFAWMLRR